MTETVTAETEAPAVVASAPPARTTPRPVELSFGQAVQHMLRAQRGDAASAAIIAAAGDVDTAGAAGLVPDQYASRILGDVSLPRPIFDNCVAKEALWSTGTTLKIPTITANPNGNWLLEGGALATDSMTLDFTDVDVKFWAHACKMSFTIIDRSSPNVVETYYRRAIQSFYSDVEVSLLTAIEGGAVGFEPAADTELVLGIFQMAAQVMATSTAAGLPANPDTVLAAPDVWARLGGKALLEGPAFSSGSIKAAPGAGDLAGLSVIACPGLTAGDLLVGDSRAVRAYGGSGSINLSALVVGTAQTEHGVYAEFAENVENALGWVKIAGVDKDGLPAHV
jgi:hypothetical protein